MSNKRFTYDIPAELDAILTRYAHTIGTDKGMVALDSLARTAQQVLTELAITNHHLIAPLQAIHRWRCEQNTISYITSGISAPSKAEHVLVTTISTASINSSYNTKLFKVKPCMRIRNYLRMPLELLQLIKSACFNTSINSFITLAIF